MTPRERFIETLTFGRPDRIPLAPGEGRESTRVAWHSQGLPRSVVPAGITAYAYKTAGGLLPWPEAGEDFPVDDRMMPRFEEKILETRKGSLIVQDWKGNICEISDSYTVEYLRDPIDFVTRRWIHCPVENREDWEQMKLRYDPAEPSRLPQDAKERAKRLADRSWVIEFHFSGPFWQIREWVGFERLCVMFYDEPELLQEMVAFWRDYVLKLLERAFGYIAPDSVHLSEDMAFKGHSMISPAMVRKYLLPCYQAWGEVIRASGCPLYAMDSDGYIAELIPLWLEAGINACDPIEVAAGNDIALYRDAFGTKMAYRGGIDKRVMARGGDVLREEIERVKPVVDTGGYIPGCDHGVPADVSWENYVETVRLLSRLTGWL
ncbi:MAG TPA: uroporphyrinogen decarboxylase family protein [Spirochaetia bacterium]|nr:uroporphyrinogen decarboxylase family protein [Spirochaetia bacterium]